MSKITVIEHVQDLPTKLDIMEYLVQVLHHDQFHCAYWFQNYSGTAVQDQLADINRSWPQSQGYTVVW